MVNIRVPGRWDGSGHSPALVDVWVAPWIRHAGAGLMWIAATVFIVVFRNDLGFDTWWMLVVPAVLFLWGVVFLYMAARSRPPRKRRRRRRNLRI